MKPLISIVTINYKQKAVTAALLDSIAKLSYPNLETIVVDNAQEGDDSDYYAKYLREVKVINSATNLGFAGGNNLGMKAAQGDYIFLVNNDTELSDGTIEALLEALKSGPYGAISPVLRYYDAPEHIQFAGFTAINALTGRNSMIRELEGIALKSTPYFHGAAVMIPRTVIEDCGLMPDEYFLYYEELDWSRKIREKGYELGVCESVYVLHKESMTTGKNSPLKTYYQTRNRLFFMNSEKGLLQKLAFRLFFNGVSMPVRLLRYALQGEFNHMRALVRAVRHYRLGKTGMAF